MDGIRVVLAGNHDDGNFLQPLIRRHQRKHIKSAERRHKQIQQYESDFRAVAPEHIQALQPIGGFQYVVAVGNQPIENGAVRPGVIDNENFHARSGILARRHIFRGDFGIRNNGIAALFCLHHQLIGAFNSAVNRLAAVNQPADADGQVQLRMLRNDDPADRLPDLVLLPHKNMLVHFGKQQ